MGTFQGSITSEKLRADEHSAFRDEARAVRAEIAKLVHGVKEVEKSLCDRAIKDFLDAAAAELHALGFIVRQDAEELEAEYEGRVSYDFIIDGHQIEVSKRQLPTERFLLSFRFRDAPPTRKIPTDLDELALDGASLEEDRRELHYWKHVAETLPTAAPIYVAQWPDRRHAEFTGIDPLLEFLCRDNWSTQL